MWFMGWVQDIGFRVQGSKFRLRVWVLGVQGLGFRVESLGQGLMVVGLAFRV